MKLLDALETAKKDGYKKAIYHPYTYHPSSIDRHIQKTVETMEDPDYKGSASEAVNWKYNNSDNSITGTNDTWYDLIK